MLRGRALLLLPEAWAPRGGTSFRPGLPAGQKTAIVAASNGATLLWVQRCSGAALLALRSCFCTTAQVYIILPSPGMDRHVGWWVRRQLPGLAADLGPGARFGPGWQVRGRRACAGHIGRDPRLASGSPHRQGLIVSLKDHRLALRCVGTQGWQGIRHFRRQRANFPGTLRLSHVRVVVFLA